MTGIGSGRKVVFRMLFIISLFALFGSSATASQPNSTHNRCDQALFRRHDIQTISRTAADQTAEAKDDQRDAAFINALQISITQSGKNIDVREIRQKGAFLRATDQPIDTESAAGKCFLDMLSVFSEFETALRRERQVDGIKLAKANGVYKGRKPSIDRDQIAKLKAEGMGPAAIAKSLGIGRASVYRILVRREG